MPPLPSPRSLPRRPSDTASGMQRVRFITVEEAQAGMRLAFPARSALESEAFNLPAGTVLNHDLILQMHHRHVTYLAIAEAETRNIAEIVQQLEYTQQQLKVIFEPAKPRQPVVESLYNSLLEYRLRFN